MCYRTQINADKIQIEQRFSAKFEFPDQDIPSGEINAFSHPVLPIITNANPKIVTAMEWGLMPFWAKDKSLQKNTLNCKIETAVDKSSFKNYISNRCLVVADGFFEWKHVMVNGKLQKEKFLLTVPGNGLFAFAGLYSNWKGINTFTILTTSANQLMAEIHNSKKRMPVVLKKEEELLWLSHEPLDDYAIRTEVELTATAV